ncbi:hypothetical protein WQ57_07010 [Mesobacillus campisalis]|uniref:Uncharacterized protein n=1 Tax=Mesobacillus campisalis TaxID=1408103 RepID=A0A0M2T1N3_9BACI|nr:hypothetical protein [Mesobacillus campisalis]KKK38730.1 hypothetical protein WQ57_07010 [Mesobacillus campisalis]
MFGFRDFIGFLWAFLLIYPIVSIVHILGHACFVRMFGGKFKVAVGRGKVMFERGPFTIHRMYFLDSYVDYTPLKWSNCITHFFVHAGGVVFNLGSTFLLNYLIANGYLEPKAVFEKYSYFSIWFATFALLPVEYGDGKYSDGLSMYLILRYKKWPRYID